MGLIRILLADDNDDFLDGLTALLKGNPRLQLIGKAHSGQAAIEQVARLHPDLLLMDVAIPDMNGFEAARRIKSEPGAPQVILLTFHKSNAAQLEAWAAGADGFIAKAEIAEKLIPTIRELMSKRHKAAVAQPIEKKEKLENRSPEKPGPTRNLSQKPTGQH